MNRLLKNSPKQLCLFLRLLLLIILVSPPFALATKPSTLSHTILSVEVTGNTFLSDDQISEATTPFIGNDLSLNEINKIVSAITEAYRKNNFFIVQVYLPEQKIESGKVAIAVSEGTVGNLVITGNRFYKTSFIQKQFPNKASITSLKQSTLLLNDYPDLQAELILKPGTVPSTADIEVRIQDEQPIHASLEYNNFGSKTISRHRFSIGFDMGNLLQDGHNLSLRAVAGSPLKSIAYYKAEYTAPIGYTGNKGHFIYAGGDFDLGGAFINLQSEMKIESVGLSVSHPFLKTHLKTLVGELSLTANHFKQTILDRTDRIRVLRGKMHYKRFDEDTRDFLSLTLSQGLGSLLGGTSNNDPMTTQPGADDLFTKARVDWVRVRSIPQPYFIPHRYTLIIAGSAQISADPLVIGEQFSSGGYDSVRGYPIRESLGDHGYFLSSELRISPFSDPRKIQTALFFDHGGTFTKQSSTATTDHSLTGVGFGVRINLPGAVIIREPDSENGTVGYFVDYRFQLRADVGFPMGDRAVSQGRYPIFYLQAVGRF